MNEARDSLQSKAVLSILDLLGEGQIGGLVSGLQSVYFNDTALQNADGTFNFQGVTADWRTGTNSQTPLPNFGNYIETPYNVSINVKKATPYTFTIANPSADAVRVIMSIPALSATDTGTGDISATSVQYKISTSIDNGLNWIDQYIDQSWGDGGTWAYESGILTLSMGVTSDNKRLRATITAYTVAAINGSIVVQPQEYNTVTGWQNLGNQRTLSVQYYGTDESGGIVANGDSLTVESSCPKIRFVPISSTSVSVGIQSTAKAVATRTTTCTISGKTRSKYQRAHLITIPRPASNVKIRVTRITADSTSAYLANETGLDSYNEIVSLNMAYPNSALFGVRIDSQQFNQLPTRSYLVDGLLIKLPSNYNPVTRTYSGIWDGTLNTVAVSNNPAWVLYDILTNKRYGLGNYLSAAQIDKANLYTIGKYCDELVPDGFGGMEPRFTLNTVISNAGDAYKVVADITSAFRGMAFWSGGLVNFTQDAPTDASMIYGRANVIDGMFSYSGSARKDRHSVVHVTWNDPQDNYRKKVEYVEDADLVALYGVKKLDTLAFGCTSRGQAARVGKWILYTEKFESDFITFKVGVDSALVQPGNVVKIQDPSRAGKRMAGRLLACSSYSATLDSAVTIASVGATISIMLADGTFVDRTVLQGVGEHTTLTWSVALPNLPVDNAMWLVAETSLVPIYARVISVTQGDGGTYEITAVEHNSSKFGAIELNLALEDRKTSIIDANFVQVPSQVSISESIYLSAPGLVANKMLITWFGNSTTFDVTYRNTTPGVASNVRTVRVENALSLEVENVALGTYEVSITGINPLGKRSTTVTKTYTVVGKQNPPSNVPTFFATPIDTGITLSWGKITDIDLKTYEVRQATSVGGSWSSATVLTQTATTEYTIANNITTGTYEWIVRAIDTTGHYSAADKRVQLVITAPDAPVVTSAITQSSVKLTWTTGITTFPIADYEVRVGPTFASATSLGHTSGRTFSVPATWSGTQTFWVVATDAVTGVTGAAGSVGVAITPPTVSGLKATLSGAQYTLEWTGNQQSLPISMYEVRYGPSGSTWATATAVADVASNTFTANVNWLGNIVFFVAALDSASNVGAATSTSVSISAPTAPSMSAAIAGTNLTLSWPTPALGSLPLDNFEVRVGAGTWASASIVSTLKGNALTLPIVWTGDRVYQIAARDVAGNLSAITTLTVTVNVPAAPTLSGSFLADSFTLAWAPPAATLPIAEYEIRYGTTWAGSADTATRVKATAYTLSAQWLGLRRWWAAAIDANGNMGTPASVDVTITAPSAPANLTRKVIDNNVLLYWGDSVGTLPVDTYKLFSGATFATAVEVGKKSGGFTTIFETQSGSYTYWLVGIDTAGNVGTPSSVTATVDQPPDYVLKAIQDLAFLGTKVNMALDLDNGYIMPVNTTETFAQHFTTRSWASPDSQISAGYPVFIEPAASPGYYEEIIDYGTTVPSTKITITTTGQVVAGAPTLTYAVSVRNLATDPWTDFGNMTVVLANNFRYVKIRFTVTGGGTDLFKLTKLNVKLDTKIKSDAGMGSAGATDAVSGTNAVINGIAKTGINPVNSSGVRVPDGDGTLVLFNSTFIDIAAIDLSLAAGGAAKYALYDFVDGTNPTGFKVLCYDAAGNRVAGNFSWGVRGY